MTINHNREISTSIWGRSSSYGGWQSTGTGCPRRLWSLHLWREAFGDIASPSERVPLSLALGDSVSAGGWTVLPPQVPANPYNSVILCIKGCGVKRTMCVRKYAYVRVKIQLSSMSVPSVTVVTQSVQWRDRACPGSSSSRDCGAWPSTAQPGLSLARSCCWCVPLPSLTSHCLARFHSVMEPPL